MPSEVPEVNHPARPLIHRPKAIRLYDRNRGANRGAVICKAMSTIVTDSRGQLIVSSTYWGSGYETAGKVFVSVNAGAIRVMVPDAMGDAVNKWRAAKYAILSRGPWPELSLPEAVEILWEDRSDNPDAIHLWPEQFDHLPSAPPTGRDWLITVWQLIEGKPHKTLERTCYWRRVDSLPWLQPLKSKSP